MKKQYIKPITEENVSDLKATFMDNANSVDYGDGNGSTPIVDDDDPDDIFSKGRKSEYSLW